MKKSEIKKLSTQQIEEIVNRMADDSQSLAEFVTERDAILNMLNAEIAPIKQKYAEKLNTFDAGIQAFQESQDENLQILATWAESKRPTLFSAKKSLEFLRGILGFRNAKPAVQTLKDWTGPKSALALLRKKWGVEYVEVKYSLKKNSLITDREKIGAAKLAACGIVIEEVEDFYFEPKSENPDMLGGASASSDK